jgi:hypothetical protein
MSASYLDLHIEIDMRAGLEQKSYFQFSHATTVIMTWPTVTEYLRHK